MDHWVGAIAAADLPFCAGYRPVCSSRGQFSLGAYLTVLCRDQEPFVDRASLATETAGDPAFAHVFQHHPYLEACEAWDVPAADALVHEPVHTGVPLLIIAGRFDSFSPPPVARAAAESFDNAWVMEVPDTHNTFGHSDCALAIRNAWLDEPNAAPTGTGCLKGMRIAFSTQEV
jgi:pimeloyl-ACP methyl ester carboxylesterase